MAHLSQSFSQKSLDLKLQRRESTSRPTGIKQMQVLGSRKCFLLLTVIVYMYGKNCFIRHCVVDKTILSGLSSQLCWSEFSTMWFYQRDHTLAYEAARICISIPDYIGDSKQVACFCVSLFGISPVLCRLMDVSSQVTNLSIRNSSITQRQIPH